MSKHAILKSGYKTSAKRVRKNEPVNIINVVTQYISRITKLSGNFFTFLASGPQHVAVFRRLSFLPVDEQSMTRLRLMPEVTPKIQTSTVNGFLIGEVVVGEEGRISRRLDGNRQALLQYLLKEEIGAYTVEKEDLTSHRFLFPGDFVEVLLARAAKLTRQEPIVAIRNHEWHVRTGPARFHVGRFREFCRIQASETFLAQLLHAKRAELENFDRLSRPCILSAFGETVDVSGAMTFFPERQNQISDRIFWKLFAAYEAFKSGFLAGRRRRPELRFQLPEITTLPKPRVWVHVPWPTDVPLAAVKPPLPIKLPRSPQLPLYKEMVQHQYQYLRDCVQSGTIRRRFRGRLYEGVVSSADTAIYPPTWVPDHFFNSLAMVDLDPALAKRMVIGGLAHFMNLSGKRAGQMPINTTPGRTDTTYPVWSLACQHLYQKTHDRDFLRAVLPMLTANDAYLERVYRKKGILVGAGGFWNDYSGGPKGLPCVAGIGMNVLAALQKSIIAGFHRELGLDATRHERQWAETRDHINDLFWDDDIGFYFDYDADRRHIYQTPRGTRFWGLDNTLALLARIPTPKRAARMAAYFRSSNGYGKYPAITTDLSDDFMDERRLMVWIMTNWMVVQGLRLYALHDIADSISANILNALTRNWVRFRSIPEALSATHGLAPMENPNLAGVGCWTGFYLFLTETRHLFTDRRP
ncbi:MAG: trehalase family glycosidase [Kiritimatiellaeota bacterium]|nr:trehalase family glycosidase [Kiritimatiellota bacterium]